MRWAALFGAFALAAGGLAVWARGADHAPVRYAGAAVPAGSTAQDFALRDQRGRRITLSGQRGHVVLLSFLYTSCTDICPVIARELDSAVRSLGARRDEARVLAVSVDPAGDTPARVRRYVRRLHLGPQFHFLIGSRSELAAVWQAYNVVDEGRPSGRVVHSAPVFLIDRSGRPRRFYTPPQPAGAFADDLHALLGAAHA